jgi:5-oxoprolinase (ATP-hydrolysing) subunit A
MVKQGMVTSVQQTDVTLRADSICVHGDGLHAVQFAKTIHERLQQEGIVVKALNK